MTKKYRHLFALNVEFNTDNGNELSTEDKEAVKQKMIELLNSENYWEHIEWFDTEEND